MSSSVPEFSVILARALLVLEDSLEDAYLEVVREIGGRTVRIRVDEEVVFIRGLEARIALSRQEHPAEVEVETTRAALLRLLGGEVTLEEVLVQDELLLQGKLDDVLAYNAALQAFFRGAVRAPAFPILLDAYVGEPRGEAAAGSSAAERSVEA